MVILMMHCPTGRFRIRVGSLISLLLKVCAFTPARWLALSSHLSKSHPYSRLSKGVIANEKGKRSTTPILVATVRTLVALQFKRSLGNSHESFLETTDIIVYEGSERRGWKRARIPRLFISQSSLDLCHLKFFYAVPLVVGNRRTNFSYIILF